MSHSKLNMCNMALAMAGSSQTITTLDYSGSQAVPLEAKLCNLYWDLAFDATARVHNWKCLGDRRDISANVTTAPVFGYETAFSQPADCLRILGTNLTGDAWTAEGRLVLADSSDLAIHFIKRTNDTSLFDPLFVEALVLRLAAYLAVALTHDQTKKERIDLWLERICLPLGRFVDSTEQSMQSLQQTTWLNSRR